MRYSHVKGFLPVVLLIWPLASGGRAEPSDGVAAAPDGRATTLVIRALGMQQAGMYWSAAGEWQTFLRHYPEHEHAHTAVFQLGECFWELELYESVATVLANYAASFPASSNVPEALKLLAMSRERLAGKGKGTFLDAAASFRNLFDAAPEGELAPFALYRESQCLYNAGRLEQACAPLEQFMGLSDSASVDLVRSARQLRGLIAWRLGDKDSAREAFEELITKWPQHGFAGHWHYFLGDLLSDEGKYGDAAEQFRIASEAKEFGPADIALLRRGKALQDGGERERAREVYRLVRQRFPDSEVVDSADRALELLEETANKNGEESAASR